MHFALCDVLRCPPAASLAPLLAAPPADLDAAVAHLNRAVAAPRAARVGRAGVAVSAADGRCSSSAPSAHATGEVVAIRIGGRRRAPRCRRPG